jgi:hypothetical protein
MELRHPHITGIESRANQNADPYLIVYTDVEVGDRSHHEYDEKLAAELREIVLKYLGNDSPYEGRIIFRRGDGKHDAPDRERCARVVSRFD